MKFRSVTPNRTNVVWSSVRRTIGAAACALVLAFAMPAHELAAAKKKPPPPPPPPTAPIQCFPTCATNDARFLVVPGGTGGNTFFDIALEIGLQRTSTNAVPTIEIFDGDTSANWDQGSIHSVYELYEDTDNDGSGDVLLSMVTSGLPNNAWAALPAIPANNTAPAYVLRLSNPNPNTAFTNWNAFKIRTTGELRISPQTFEFLAPLGNLADAQTVYPNYPNLTPTTYDGQWTFNFFVDTPLTTLAIWDGDFDFGRFDCSVNDTDDADTPPDPPIFAGPSAQDEGVATGGDPCVNGQGQPTGGTATGSPVDDNDDPLYRRSPNMSYELIDPTGRHFANNNPSGNLEWEQFSISSDPNEPADYHVNAQLPAGQYTVVINGVDMGNLNAWHIPFPISGQAGGFCVKGPNPSGNVPPCNGGMRPCGFFTIGSQNGADVYVQDLATGTEFGPFKSTTNIKYTEANGKTPSIKKMAGVVSWHIQGQGDAAVYTKVNGQAVPPVAICLVPPKPK